MMKQICKNALLGGIIKWYDGLRRYVMLKCDFGLRFADFFFGLYHSSVSKNQFLAISGAETSPMVARMSKNGALGGFCKWHDAQAWYYMLKWLFGPICEI